MKSVLSKKMKIGVAFFGLILSLTFSLVGVSQATASIERLWGITSADTANAICQKGWPNGSKVAIVARDDYFTDALAGGPLAKYVAYKYGSSAPILLTNPSHLNNETRAEIIRLGAEQIYLLGGEGAVSKEVENALGSISGVKNVSRLWGQSAYGTALAIKAEMVAIGNEKASPLPDTAIITTGENFPDSLVISGPAAFKNMPILLVKPFASEPPQETKLALQGITQIIIVGGPGAVHPSLEAWLNSNGHTVIKRLWGLSEYDTAIDVVSSGNVIFNFDKRVTILTRGDYFTDALSGGAFASMLGPAPMVLARPDSVPQVTHLWLMGNRDQMQTVYILGGQGALSELVEWHIKWLDAKPQQVVQRFLDSWNGHIAQTPATYNVEADMANWNKMWDLLTDKAQNEWSTRLDEGGDILPGGVYGIGWEVEGVASIVSSNQTGLDEVEFVVQILVQGYYEKFRVVVRKENGLWKIDEVILGE